MSRSPRPRIAIVSGSARAESLTYRLLKVMESEAKEQGLDTHFVCAREFDLPLFESVASQNNANAERWRDLVQASDGLIIGSPEYHGTFSGALKNMIDYLDFPHIEGKPVGLVATAGGPKAGVSTLNALRLMFRALHVPVVVEQAALWKGDLDPETKRPNPDALKQVFGVIGGVAREVKRCLAVK
jgi:azobenzene reductase